MNIIILVLAVLLDLLLGDPHNWHHPVIYIGKMIGFIEQRIRKYKIPLRFGGFILALGTILIVQVILTLLLFAAHVINYYIYIALIIYLTYTALASKCLAVESKKVYNSLDNIKEARKELSYLVGRDTSELSINDIIRATVETIAENTIDGILAPVFFLIIGLLLGVPVQMVYLYKTINTLDSMVGYVQEPYREIGFASAKIDDIANYLPARIGSAIMIIAGMVLRYDWKNGIKILKRDCRNHKSPNCGYPESAVAGLLNIQIGGTNTYFGQTVYKPTIGDKMNETSPQSIIDTINIMYGSCILSTLIGCLILVIQYFSIKL